MKRERYFADLRLLEVATFFAAKPPSLKAVRTWREKSPDSARFALLAPRDLTHPRGPASGPEAEAAIARLAECCAALGAEAVVFRTPASFSPSATGRAALERFFAELATAERFGSTERVWDPDGLWEPDAVAGECERLGILGTVDPLANDPLEEGYGALERHHSRGKLYMRPVGMGRARRRFDHHELEALAELADGCERAWVVFANPDKWRDATALAKLITEQVGDDPDDDD